MSDTPFDSSTLEQPLSSSGDLGRPHPTCMCIMAPCNCADGFEDSQGGTGIDLSSRVELLRRDGGSNSDVLNLASHAGGNVFTERTTMADGSGSTALDWFDAINQAAAGWASVITGRPNPATVGQGGVIIQTGQNGISAGFSQSSLLMLGLGVVAIIVLTRK